MRHERTRAKPPRARLARSPASPPVFGPIPKKAPLAAFFVGISSRLPAYAMIGATLTTRLAQDGITKSTGTAFALAFLVYNLKFLWAWIVDGVRIPFLTGFGQRVSWLILVRPAGDRGGRQPRLSGSRPPTSTRPRSRRSWSAFAGATYDIVIDAYRIEIARAAPARRRLGHVAIWLADRLARGGRAGAGARPQARLGWEMAYLACAVFAAAGDAHRR